MLSLAVPDAAILPLAILRQRRQQQPAATIRAQAARWSTGVCRQWRAQSHAQHPYRAAIRLQLHSLQVLPTQTQFPISPAPISEDTRMREKSIELLNKAMADELSAIHQYMYFHFHCDDQGYDLLAGLFKRTAIEEMGHVERFAERILFLKGDVGMNAASEVKQIQDVTQMLKTATQMEQQSIEDYNHWAIECGTAADAMTKQLFEGVIADEERHFDQFDTELDNLEKFGEKYLVLQSMERSRTSAGGDTAD
jgi:bacterioferritin